MTETTVEPPRCGNCPMFLLTDVSEGECHAEPPRVFPMPGPGGRFGTIGVFPPSKPTNWCAKHPGLRARMGPDLLLKGG